MKVKLKRLIMCVIVCITILNLLTALIPTVSTTVQADAAVINEVQEVSSDNSNPLLSKAGAFLDGITGFATTLLRIPFVLITMAVQGILGGIANLGGSKIEGFLTPDDIFFNRVGLTEIDFFNFTGEVNAVQQIRKNIATWYYILRVLSTVILLAVLIYIGIRMAISTVASEQAQYKRMLKDWVVSFALLFLLNYIIMFTIEANNALVYMLSQPARVTIGSGVVNKLAAMAVGVDTTSGLFGFTIDVSATRTWGALIVYCMLVGMTAAFLFMYVKRMLTIGFLIVISPLITITYSIDKVKDGKAQALNTWFREFMVTVLIQPFHCIIYLIFISAVLNMLLGQAASLAAMVLAIMCMSFIWKAEGIVKEIFGLHDKSGVGDAFAAWATVKSVSGALGKAGASAAGVGPITKFGQNIMNKAPTPIKTAATAVKNAGNWAANTKLGKFEYAVAKKGLPLATGIVAASAEMGVNTKANALQVGSEAYGLMKGRMDARENADGSEKNIKLSQDQLKKVAGYISKNNSLGFDPTDRNQLQTYAESLIGTNMDYLQNNIQAALSALTAANPTEYNTTSAAGMQNLRDLQDMALNTSLDFTNASTNPLGHAWTAEEKQVVTAIQTRDFARDVNRLYSQMQASGSNNPTQDVKDYIASI